MLLTLLVIAATAIMLPVLLAAALIFLCYFLRYVAIVLAVLLVILFAVGFIKAAFANKFEVFISFYKKCLSMFQTSRPGVLERLKNFDIVVSEMPWDSANFIVRYFRTGWAWVRAGGNWEI